MILVKKIIQVEKKTAKNPSVDLSIDPIVASFGQRSAVEKVECPRIGIFEHMSHE